MTKRNYLGRKPVVRALWLSNCQTFSNDNELYCIDIFSRYLTDNEIAWIDENTFRALPNLEILDMENNKITVLDKRFFKGLPKIKRLAVEDNPLHCDCILAEFVMFAKSRNLTLKFGIEPKCSTPSNLTGVLLRDLSSEVMDCDVTTATTLIKKTTSKNLENALICLRVLTQHIL
ncbi:leucine-rich repeat transmembrane protein FLRT1-like [Saccostrea cucullata]|uniref:leucine-rich repeat transmembrane protein FLRT1-like n=1 Tax=Saccostrea cuccullata TaxID=36930 RepID=UPI002ED6556C